MATATATGDDDDDELTAEIRRRLFPAGPASFGRETAYSFCRTAAHLVRSLRNCPPEVRWSYDFDELREGVDFDGLDAHFRETLEAVLQRHREAVADLAERTEPE